MPENKPLLLCVPNFSEGRDAHLVNDIAAAAGEAGATLMDVSLDADHNRSVIAFFGSPDVVIDAVLESARVAVRRIDLTRHKGAHPRFGALDVAPLVPLRDTALQCAIEASRELGARLAGELHLPVFLYENGASHHSRHNLADVRRMLRSASENETMPWPIPDFGEPHPHPTAGCVAVGARGPLVAYNVNLAGPDLDAAVGVAAEIRRRRDLGEGFAGVKAMGVLLESRGVAQISTNVTLPDICRPRDVFEFVSSAAARYGVRVGHSELVGVVSRRHLSEEDVSAMQFEALRPGQFIEHWLRD